MRKTFIDLLNTLPPSVDMDCSAIIELLKLVREKTIEEVNKLLVKDGVDVAVHLDLNSIEK